MSPPARPRRGEHSNPSRSARYLPALLLLVPAGSLVGLRASHDTSPSHLAHLALAAHVTEQREELTSSGSGSLAMGAGTDVGEELPPKRVVTLATSPTHPRVPVRASRLRSRPLWVLPASGRLSSRFGPRWGSFHPGIDIAAPTGQPVQAAAAGTVMSAGWGGGYGNLIRIRHSSGTVTVYAHMSRLLVADGQTVSAGELIGEIGSTGFSTGPHLHFEVRPGDAAIDPLAWLHAHGVTFYGSAQGTDNAADAGTHPQD